MHLAHRDAPLHLHGVQDTGVHGPPGPAEQGAAVPAVSPAAPKPPVQQLAYRTLVNLKTQTLDADGVSYRLSPGMQVSAEIHLGTRTVLEYLLSPVQKAFQEAGRER